MTDARYVADCIVVGAGMAGLSAAERLRQRGLDVIVLDKGAGVGGRMATRRINSAVCDHGAQFFTVRDPAVRAELETWLDQGVARQWCAGFPGADGAGPTDGHPRYLGVGGMLAVAKHLARNLDVRIRERAVRAELAGARWRVTTETGAYTADRLLLTPPVPQTLALLDAGGFTMPPAERERLGAVAYDPCIALLAVLAGPSGIPVPGAIQFAGEPLSWIADNQIKGISPGVGCVTIHAGPDFSRAHWESPDGEISRLMLGHAGAWVSEPTLTVQVHRWRYAKAARVHPDRCLLLPGSAPLAFAGDGFGAARVEGAVLSGLAAADALLGAAPG